jgi:hypothetical protein
LSSQALLKVDFLLSCLGSRSIRLSLLAQASTSPASSRTKKDQQTSISGTFKALLAFLPQFNYFQFLLKETKAYR